MLKKAFACIMIGALLGSAALAEYRWEGEYPAAAANLPNAYTVAANPRVKALAEHALKALAFPQSGISWEDGELWAQDRPEDTGERATLRYNSRGDLHYNKDTQAHVNSDPNDALQASLAFGEKALGTAEYMYGMPHIVWYYEEDGQLLTHIYEFVWPILTPEGVPVMGQSLSITYANGLVSRVDLWDALLTVAEGATAYPFADSQKALNQLNAAAVGEMHSSALDDPNDKLERIYLTYTPVFGTEDQYTLAWAFEFRDARSHQLKQPVFVEVATGRVHDGRRILE